jgi:hypothetical protein
VIKRCYILALKIIIILLSRVSTLSGSDQASKGHLRVRWYQEMYKADIFLHAQHLKTYFPESPAFPLQIIFIIHSALLRMFILSLSAHSLPPTCVLVIYQLCSLSNDIWTPHFGCIPGLPMAMLLLTCYHDEYFYAAHCFVRQFLYHCFNLLVDPRQACSSSGTLNSTSWLASIHLIGCPK